MKPKQIVLLSLVGYSSYKTVPVSRVLVAQIPK